MIATSLLLMIVAAFPVDDGSETSPLTVLARIALGVHYAGEAIPIAVELVGGSRPIAIEPPRLKDGEIHQASESHFVLIPRRSGPLVVPAFTARSGSSLGRSKAIRLTVAAVPAGGRPAWFLGGVGMFEATASVEPASVRAGQAVEYRLSLTGPAAWGSTRAPDLSGWVARIPGLRVEPLPSSEVAGELPTRTFRYRLRPTRAGKWTLPPVPVSAFDPKTGHYATRSAPGLPLEVTPLDRFDPATLDVRPRIKSRSIPAQPRPVWVAVAILAMLPAFTLAAWVWRRRAGRIDDPGRFAQDLASRLDPNWDEALAATRITEGLAEYLRIASGRPSGALTPDETRAAILIRGNDPTLADRAGRLVEACDRARFGDGESEKGRLVIEAKTVLASLAKDRGRQPGPLRS